MEQSKINHKKSQQKKVEKQNKEYYGVSAHGVSANNLIYDQYNEFSSKKEGSIGIDSGYSTFRSNNTASKKLDMMDKGENSSTVYGITNPPSTSYNTHLSHGNNRLMDSSRNKSWNKKPMSQV